MNQAHYARGVSVIRTFAELGGASPSQALANFKSLYGEETIASIGERASLVNFSHLQDKLKDAISAGADPLNPPMSVINSAIFSLLGQTPSVVNVATGVIGDTADAIRENLPSVNTVVIVLGVLSVAATIGGIIYLKKTTGT